MKDSLSATFSALADPTRRALLSQLARGEASVSDLAQPFMNDMTLPAVTKHLKVLESAGLIQKTRSAQWRTCSLSPAPLKEVSGWVEQYRQYWEESFDRLEDYLKAFQAEQTQQKKKKKKVRRVHARKAK